MADHETNDSIDRGHDTPNVADPAQKSRERSSWPRRLDLLDATPQGDPIATGDRGPALQPASNDDSEVWEEVSSGSTSGAATRLPTASPDSVSTEASVWPDPDGLDISLAAARRENADRRAEITGLRGALGAAHQQLRARETEIADLTTRLSVATATMQARQGELSALGTRCKGVEEKLAAKDHELCSLRDELQRSAEVAEKRESQLENLRTTRTTLEETVKARDRVIGARDEELGAREQELQAVRLHVAAHQKSISERDAELAMLADQLLAQQERARALEAEIGGREQVVANQRDKLAERDDQLASLLATLDVVERTLARRPGVAELSATKAAKDFGARSEPITNTGYVAEPDPRPEQRRGFDFGREALVEEAEEEELTQPATEEVQRDIEPDDDVEELLTASEENAERALDDESVADEVGETSNDEGVEPGRAPSHAFDAELDVLAVSGNVFRQRPPPPTPVFRWWRDQQIQKTEALPAASFDELITNTIARECAARADQTIAVLSICGADPELELRVSRALLAQGHENFVIDCFDDRETWHDARANLAEAAGLAEKIDSLPATYESFVSNQKFDVFIVDGSLQYAADLAAFFEHIKQAWKDDSLIVMGATLGSSAASTSPEHIETVDRIWNVMSDRYMHNHVTGEQQTHFVPAKTPSDAAAAGGALSPGSTPLLPMLLDRYFFEVFTVFGNLINAFLGPEIGPNFDPAEESDRSFIERFSKLDEAQIDAGAIHPLHMVAVLRSSSVGDTVMIENRAPERCLVLGQPANEASEG